MKKYSTWLKTAAVFQIIAALLHAVSLFVTLPANNETEKQLIKLMDTYQFDLGAGFHRTMAEMMFVFSACFCLVCLLGGSLNWYLVDKKVAPQIMKGVITINLVLFVLFLGVVSAFAFLEPIILIGLIVVFLVLARLTLPKAVGDRFG